MDRKYFSIYEPEQGSVAVLLIALLAGGALLTSLTKEIYEMIHPNLILPLQLVAGAILLFSVIYLIRSLLSGEKSFSQVYKELKHENDALGTVITEAIMQIKDVESKLPSNMLAISADGLKSLGYARKIVKAAKKRHEEISSLLKRRGKVDLIDAYEITQRSLVITENCCESLIGSTPIPAIEADKIGPTIQMLLEKISSESSVAKAA